MLRSDGTSFNICKGCGTVPIENPKTGLFVCPLCTGPVNYIGSGAHDLELIPPTRKTMVAPVTLEMPYAFKLLTQELETYMNIGMRIMTEKDLLCLDGLSKSDLPPLTTEVKGKITLPARVLPETAVPEYRVEETGPVNADPALLMKLGALPPATPRITEGDDIVVDGKSPDAARSAIDAAVAQANAGPGAGPISGSLVQTDKGPVFQPNPTVVTVVPAAKTIQVVGAPENIVADEDLTVQAPQAQPLAPQPLAPPQPQAQGQFGGYGPMYYGSPQMMPYPYQMPYPGVNMGQSPAVYSTPAQAQIFTSGVPGAPPTIAVSTDDGQMGNFLNPQGPKPMRSTVTLRKRSVQPAQESGSGSADATFKITVIKGS
jgi:hypothetical protein